VQGDVLLEATANCYVQSDKSLVATGVSNVIIIHTPRRVADRGKLKTLFNIVAHLKQANRKVHGAYAATAVGVL
jgi:hypothetical protein